MNKLFTKIAALALGATMAVGVGVAVASGGKEAAPAEAASPVEITLSTTGCTATGYDSGQERTWTQDGTSFGAVYLMKSGSNMQFQKSNAKVYNTTAMGGNITGITLTVGSGTARNWSLKLGTTRSNVAAVSGYNASSTGWSTISGSYTFFEIHSPASGASYLSKITVTYASAKTLSSISLGGSYATQFTVGDTFNHTGMTVTANYSDSTSATVTSSATWSSPDMSSAGQKTVTVSYTEGSTTKTANYTITVVAPTTPTLSLDKASFSGYTGQSVSITATYANLESDLAWSASGTGSITGGTITWSSSDHRNGTSTYTCTLSGEGGKTIVADADGVDAAQCVLTITQTTVDITKASTSISVGKSETLAASHNASSVGGLNWTSSDNSIATVASDGKVTVDSGATVGDTVTITATSSVDTGVSDTCTVTVAEAPAEDVITLATTGVTSTSYASGDFSGKSATNTGHTDAVYAGQIIKSSNGYIQMRATNPGGIVSTGSGGKVRGVTITWDTAAMASNARTLDIYCNTSAYSSAADLYSTSTDGDKVGSITYTNTTTYDTYLSISGDYTYVGLRSNTSAMYIKEIDIEWELPNQLSSVSVSFASDPADRTFYAGSNFAFNGTLTASYTVDSPKAVTPASYHLNSEGGTAITTSTVLTVSAHNGKSVYVVYTEGGVTKSDSFTLIVNPAPATSVTLSANVGSVALEEVFEVSSITATVNPSAYATQGVTWEVYDSGGLIEDDTYVFDGAEFYATEPADVVFHVKSTATPSVYASFTLTITGDPIAHLLDGELIDVTDGSASVYGDAGTLTYGVTTENFEGTITYTWATSNSSIISIDDDQGDMCDFYVEGVAGSARLSCRVQGSTKGDVTVYIDVTVTAVTVTSVTWTAPTIDVFSGETLSSTSGWNVKYSTNSGKTDQTPDSFNVKLGGTTISLPYTWNAADDGKTLCVEYGGVSSSTTTVAVTQSINAVNATLTDSWDHTFTAKAWSAKGDWTISEKLWNMSGTDDGSPYFGYDATKGQQFGSGTHPFSDVSLQSSAFSGTVASVTVYTSGANSINATVQVSVGGTAYGSAQTITNTNTPYKFDLGGKSGTISIDWVNSSSKAIYVKEIVVNTVSGSQNIANNASHKAAQRAAVAYAMAFNEAMDDTNYCTTGLDAAWTTCSNAYNSFKTAAAALGETEEAWAKNLVKYATAQYSDDSGEACIERMMKTYEVCVQKHGKNAFMNDLVTLGRASNTNPITIIGAKSDVNVVAIVVITSVVSLTAIGGYFFLRKRKENI